MKKAICPGSFDPITKGHIDIITRASLLFDEVTVLIVVNPNKHPHFSLEERKALAEKASAHLKNVRVDVHEGLLADYVKQNNINVIVKGLRAMSDFEYEFQMALTNKALVPETETVFLNTGKDFLFTSSSLVRELASFGGDISKFVPEEIYSDVIEHYKQNYKIKNK